MTLVDNCNTFTTSGFHLGDLPQLRNQVWEAVRLHAQDQSYTTYPTQFSCSHCGNEHPITPEEIRDSLFRGPGQVDFAASYNEFMAAIHGVPASAMGIGVTNGVSTGTDMDIAEVINPATVIDTPTDPVPVIEDLQPEITQVDQEIVKDSGGV